MAVPTGVRLREAEPADAAAARECLFVDGRMVDELYMAKLFPPP